MGKMDKTEKYTVAGLCFGGSGVFLCEDAVVCARVYGYCDGTVVEFCLGIACIVIATVSLYIAVGVLLLALCAGGACLALKGGKTGGATLGGYDDMTEEEIQAELDRQARESMMTISLDMTPTLSADGSKLAVRVANVEENRFNQLIEVEQDGKVVGSYKGHKPGEKLDEVDVTGAKPGAATVTVQAMEDGEPSGNPSGFEVTIAASE